MAMIKYSRALVSILVGIAVLAAVTSSGASVMKAKPRQPVQITIEAAQPGVTPDNIRPGDVVDLVVSAISYVDTDAMTLTVSIPEGVVLLSGNRLWKGRAIKQEKKAMPISVRVPQNGAGEIRAQIFVSLPDGNSFTASSQFSLGGSKKTKSEKKRPVKKDSKGDDVIEYR